MPHAVAYYAKNLAPSFVLNLLVQCVCTRQAVEPPTHPPNAVERFAVRSVPVKGRPSSA